MTVDFAQWGSVTLALSVLLILPAVPISNILAHQRNWPEVTLGAIVLCFGSQSILGMVWSGVVGHSSLLEISVFCLIWGPLFFYGGFVWLFRFRPVAKSPASASHVYIIGILAAAFLIRSIHPLQTLALGQSDAYAHLNFLRDIVEQGRLNVPVYPPGYHWLLALPVLIFNIDPYQIARFAGAFFGTALVLAIYVLLYRRFNRRAALFGSFCAGCIPVHALYISP